MESNNEKNIENGLSNKKDQDNLIEKENDEEINLLILKRQEETKAFKKLLENINISNQTKTND